MFSHTYMVSNHKSIDKFTACKSVFVSYIYKYFNSKEYKKTVLDFVNKLSPPQVRSVT